MFDGVNNSEILSSYKIFIIRLDLCAQRLSNTKHNFLWGYFYSISSTRASKYFAKDSLVVPFSLINCKNSTPNSEIQAVQVKFLPNKGFLYKIAGVPTWE